MNGWAGVPAWEACRRAATSCREGSGIAFCRSLVPPQQSGPPRDSPGCEIPPRGVRALKCPPGRVVTNAEQSGMVTVLLRAMCDQRYLMVTDQAIREAGPRSLTRHTALPAAPAGSREDACEPGEAGQRS